METLALSLPPPLRRTATTAASYRYRRFTCRCLSVPHTIHKVELALHLKQDESGQQEGSSGNDDNAPGQTSVPTNLKGREGNGENYENAPGHASVRTNLKGREGNDENYENAPDNAAFPMNLKLNSGREGNSQNYENTPDVATNMSLVPGKNYQNAPDMATTMSPESGKNDENAPDMATNITLKSGENYTNAPDITTNTSLQPGGNDGNAPPGVPWKEQERRRKISETRRRRNTQLKFDEAEIRKEMERRRKISETKRGSVPWNLGKKHSPETREKIGRRIAEALRDPKVRMNMKGMKGKDQSKKAKELISAQLKRIWAERLKSKRAQQKLHDNWAEIIAINAKSGGYDEKSLDWDEYDRIMKEIISEEILVENERRMEREKKKAREEILARMKSKKSSKGVEDKKEEVIRTKAKIRAKYGTQSFNLDLKKRLSRLYDVKKKLDSSSDLKEMERKRTNSEWDIEFIKERLDIGVSLSSQLEMVKNRKKQEKINSE